MVRLNIYIYLRASYTEKTPPTSIMRTLVQGPGITAETRPDLSERGDASICAHGRAQREAAQTGA